MLHHQFVTVLLVIAMIMAMIAFVTYSDNREWWDNNSCSSIDNDHESTDISSWQWHINHCSWHYHSHWLTDTDW